MSLFAEILNSCAFIAVVFGLAWLVLLFAGFTVEEHDKTGT